MINYFITKSDANMQKSNYLFAVLSLALLLASCISEDINTNVDCNACYPYRVQEGQVEILVSLTRQQHRVPIVIYRDNIEEGFVEFRDTAVTDTHRIWLATEQAYAVTATYLRNGDTIRAVDGTNLEIEEITGQCDSTCWIAAGGSIDLRLAD